MTHVEKVQFIQSITNNWAEIMEEYNTIKKTNPTPGFDEHATKMADWRCITLWWNYTKCQSFQKRMPFTSNLLEHGPSHHASGWLILNPHTRTDNHNHKDWGHKIIMHFPTYIPEGDVGFNVEGKVYHWKMGEYFAFDCFDNHYGYNNTDEARSIMVLDFDYDEWIDVLRPYMRLNNE